METEKTKAQLAREIVARHDDCVRFIEHLTVRFEKQLTPLELRELRRLQEVVDEWPPLVRHYHKTSEIIVAGER